MPPGAVYVGRPTKWGNPFTIGRYGVFSAVGAYAAKIKNDRLLFNAARRELRGKDLACFCPLDQPCHADVLLEIANTPPPGSGADHVPSVAPGLRGEIER